MNKKFSAVAGVVTAGLTVFALAAPATAFAAEDTGNKGASNNATVTIDGGDLSLDADADQTVTFAPVSVKDIIATGTEATTSNTFKAPVSDYRGTDGNWFLTVVGTGFKGDAGTLAADLTTTADGSDTVATQEATVTEAAANVATGTGAYGENSLDFSFGLNIKQANAVKAGSYANTLTWTLAAGVPNDETTPTGE
jgi:hypothetical protein